MSILDKRAGESPFLLQQIEHADPAVFADESVNLKREDAEEYR